MNSTYRALIKAGFSQSSFPKLQDVMFITEPEAATVYTVRHYRDELAQTTLQVCLIWRWYYFHEAKNNAGRSKLYTLRCWGRHSSKTTIRLFFVEMDKLITM